MLKGHGHCVEDFGEGGPYSYIHQHLDTGVNEWFPPLVCRCWSALDTLIEINIYIEISRTTLYLEQLYISNNSISRITLFIDISLSNISDIFSSQTSLYLEHFYISKISPSRTCKNQIKNTWEELAGIVKSFENKKSLFYRLLLHVYFLK